jgi:DNA-binding winged helix-turn-helix (wHTH) protein/predicted ATPase
VWLAKTAQELDMKPARTNQPPPVRIESANEWAWCGSERLDLTPRTFAVLRHLVEHPQRLITKDDMLAAVWGETTVSDAALTSCIRDLRQALNDSARTPRYIETVHRRGFRFIGPITNVTVGRAVPVHTAPDKTAPEPQPSTHAPTTLVGRDEELAFLHARLATARKRQRRLVLVTGEPGIGKTTLVETFLGQVSADRSLRIGRGQCVEQYGAGEAYMPVLEALGRLGRAADGERLVQTLKQYAPTWLVQLPALLTDSDLEIVSRRAQGATRERMLRELVEALDAISSEDPVVLVLEDLHWSDSATIDLLAMLARRREPAGLLIVGTYRPADVAVKSHPLQSVKQELLIHGLCEELALEFLSVAAVREYLARRLVPHDLPSDFSVALHRITDGNPLFLVNTIEDLIARGQVLESDGRWKLAGRVEDVTLEVPHTLAQIVAQQVERLTAEEQAILTLASVAGAEYSAALAVADGIDPNEAERRCEALARRGQFLRASGAASWPDGTVAARYTFIHALYRNVLYARVPIGHRVGLHLRIGERLERAYGARAADIAGELALHFEQGRDFERAARYQMVAGEHALRRHGYREAADHLTRALTSLNIWPESKTRTEQELMLQVMLGTALTALKGHAAREVEAAYARARLLSEDVDDAARLRLVMPGLTWFYLVRGPAATVRQLTARLTTMAGATGDRAMMLAAHHSAGAVAYYAGEFETARDHLEQGVALYDPAAHSPNRSPVFRANVDPGVSCALHSAGVSWVLGYPERAAARVQEALAIARAIDHPFSVAHAHRFSAALYHSQKDDVAAGEHAEASAALAIEHGFGAVLKAVAFHQGWVLAQRGNTDAGLPPMREWLPICRDISAAILLPAYLAWLAEVQHTIGHPMDGLALVDEGFTVARRSGYAYWTAELYRLKGLLFQHPGAAHPARSSREKQAEACFLEALQIARQQRAKLFELRAATALSRLWANQGKASDALALLSEIYAWFTEGFETVDLRESAALLDHLRSS